MTAEVSILDIVNANVCGLNAFPAGWQAVQRMCPVGGLCNVINVVLASV